MRLENRNEATLKDDGNDFDYCVDLFMRDMTIRNLSYHTMRWYKIVDRSIISYDFEYYHYSINSFSKIHCLQKMTLILAYQIIYKTGGNVSKELQQLIKIVFENNKNELEYIINTILPAKDFYGMTAIENVSKNKLLDIIEKEMN